MARKRQPPSKRDNNVAEVAHAPTSCDGNIDLLPRPRWPRTVAGRLLIVAAGIVLSQTILYGPSLIGRKILLPIDHLAMPGVYTPLSATKPIIPHNFARSDLIFLVEPIRHFSAGELAAGRWPVWTPYQYAGTPMPYGKYSPMWVLRSCVESPVVIAWVQVLISLSIGFGAYVFCRRVLEVEFWPAALAAWCYPMTGFFIFWEGYPLAWVAAWLPWLLWAVDATVRRPGSWGPLAVAVVTFLTVADRQLDIAGQVLLIAGLFAVWRMFDLYGWQWFAQRWPKSAIDTAPAASRPLPQTPLAVSYPSSPGKSFLRAALALSAGWTLGFLMAAPCLLPTLEYARTGIRMHERGSGKREERPPIGLAALPQTVLPDMYGSTQRGNYWVPPQVTEKDEQGREFARLSEGNQLESPSAAYAGLLATLLVAPLAWCSRRHRSIVIGLTALGFLGLAWSLDVPGIVWMLRLPGLNMMSHNRLVFVTSLAVIALMAIGLDVVWRGPVQRRWWFWLPLAVLVVLLGLCFHRTTDLPEPIATQLQTAILMHRPVQGIADLESVKEVQANFVRSYMIAGALCALGVAGWLALWSGVNLRRWGIPVLGTLLVADLLWFAYDRSAQCDPSLYYPPIPALEELKTAAPGRIIGVGCFPALLNHIYPLGDVRGNDGVEPARLIDLARIAEDPRSLKLEYSAVQWMTPKIIAWTPHDFRISPVLDMLNVCYVIFRGNAPPKGDPGYCVPDFTSPDYWIRINRNALPRAYVPERIETVVDNKGRLAKMAAKDFNPRQVAFVEEPLEGPIELPAVCRGSAEIVEEIPTRIDVSLDMKTPGMVVLSDLWDVGWRAYYDGNAVRILRTNHAIRGVVVPAGKGTLEFRYEPASVVWGLRLGGLALVVLAGWTAAVVWISRRHARSCPTIKGDEG